MKKMNTIFFTRLNQKLRSGRAVSPADRLSAADGENPPGPQLLSDHRLKPKKLCEEQSPGGAGRRGETGEGGVSDKKTLLKYSIGTQRLLK